MLHWKKQFFTLASPIFSCKAGMCKLLIKGVYTNLPLVALRTNKDCLLRLFVFLLGRNLINVSAVQSGVSKVNVSKLQKGM